ncbi:hypothetical protein GFS60_04550 [Rhodococcus sp. WAY2]|nr:hypothetical protein GFS60_04550 [Rhodococcus sp. WAY2]
MWSGTSLGQSSHGEPANFRPLPGSGMKSGSGAGGHRP